MEAMIRQCEVLKEKLVLIKEHPDFLKLFSQDEIFKMNLTERGIAEVISSIGQVKDQISFDNEVSRREEILDTIGIIKMEIKRLEKFTNSNVARLPRPKTSAIMWILAPDFLVKYLIRKGLHKIKMAKLSKMNRKALQERERLEAEIRKLNNS